LSPFDKDVDVHLQIPIFNKNQSNSSPAIFLISSLHTHKCGVTFNELRISVIRLHFPLARAFPVNLRNLAKIQPVNKECTRLKIVR
jgi:hypothetical protein